MRLTTRMLRRDFSTPLVTPDVKLEPVRYSWHALGGPETAEIRAAGSPWAVWALCDWLRAPIEILDERGEAVWWGYVAEVTVGTGAVELGLSLEQMANRVAVSFQDNSSGSAVNLTTEWLEDADSVDEFGAFERLASLSNGSAEAAAGLRARMLTELHYPVSVIRHTGRGDQMTATIRCRGWWSSLAWQYYANGVLTGATTTAQIAAILTEKAQFITGSDLLATGDISLSQYQDGTANSQTIIENLLAAGLADGTGLLATVTRDREVRIATESADDRLFLQADGVIRDLWDNPLLQHTCPVGQWCLLRDVIPPTVDVGRMANPTRFFVQRSEFTAANWSLVLEPRGSLSPWQALSSSGGSSGGGNSGQTWVGRIEGPHAGLFAIENQDDASWSVLLRVVDTANVPFVSAGERNYVSNSKWLRLGYADALHIKLADSTGGGTDPEDHPDIEVPAAALTGTVPAGVLSGVLLTNGSLDGATSGAQQFVVGSRHGDDTHHADFDGTGHLTFAGNARPWRDELGELIGKKRKGTRITEDLDEGDISFSDACVITDDWVIINVQLNHDKDLSASIYPHLHWFQASANVPNWLIEYRWQLNGGAKTTAWTRAKYTGMAFTYTAGTLNQIALFAAIAPPGGTALSDIVQFRIQRDTNNASGLFGTPGTDPLTGVARAVMFDAHFQVNSAGSTDEYSK